jgi:hypothetical protein
MNTLSDSQTIQFAPKLAPSQLPKSFMADGGGGGGGGGGGSKGKKGKGSKGRRSGWGRTNKFDNMPKGLTPNITIRGQVNVEKDGNKT